MKLKLIILLSLSVLFVGCADTHNIIRNTPEKQTKLSKDAGFYITISKDGTYGTSTYSNSGIMTARAILEALSLHASNIQIAEQYNSIDESKIIATQDNCGYLINPTILHWEDRNTEWSGKPDKIAVKIEIISIPDGLVIDSATINGKSKWVTFGGDHPQDLLPKPFGEYFDQLF